MPHDHVERAFTTITLHFTRTDMATALGAPILLISDWEQNKCEENTAGRLRTCCAGLLEVRVGVNHPLDASRDQRPYIEYLHRSVADFIVKERPWSSMLQLTEQTEFEPSVALLRSVVRSIKLTDSDYNARAPH